MSTTVESALEGIPTHLLEAEIKRRAESDAGMGPRAEIIRHRRIATMADPQTAAVADWLRKQAQQARSFAAYVTANRDDWYSTAPAHLEDSHMKKAAIYDDAVSVIEMEIKTDAELKKMFGEME